MLCWLSCPMACGILVPQPGIELMSPVLPGRWLTTGPPQKSLPSVLMVLVTLFLDWHPLAILPNFKWKQQCQSLPTGSLVYFLQFFSGDVYKGGGRVFGEWQNHCAGRDSRTLRSERSNNQSNSLQLGNGEAEGLTLTNPDFCFLADLLF